MLEQKFIERLVDSVQWSRRQLASFQMKRMDILRQYVGRHYGGTAGCRERVPQNFIRLQLSILTRHLVSRNPAVMCEASEPSLRPVAFGLQQWANKAFQAMGLELTLKRWAMDALIFPIGMIKVCSGMSSVYDGHPDLVAWADTVDPERSVYDMNAASWNQLDYIGHRYTAPKESLTGPGFDQALVASLEPDRDQATTDEGVEKTESLQQEDQQHDRRLRDYIDCWELFLPKEGILVTFPIVGNEIDRRPIRFEEYLGPRNSTNTGPFHILGFDEVPGALMPTPPVHAILDMHEAINRGTRKLLRQMDRQKTNLLVSQAGSGDADKVRRAGDGDIVPVTHPDAFQETRFGGPDQQNLAYLLHLKNQISYFGGNFEVMGGLGAQAPTKGQEELLAASSSKLIEFYQGETVGRTKGICEALLWHEWHSRRPMPFTVQPEGLPEFATQDAITPEDRYGGGVSRWGQIGIDVHPYSMRPVSPEQRVGQWMQLFQQLIMPMAPMLMQQGAAIDFVAFVKKMAQYMGLPDLDEVLRIIPVDIAAQQEQQGGGSDQSPRIRPPGTGEYTRTSVSGPEAQDQEVMAAMQEGEAE